MGKINHAHNAKDLNKVFEEKGLNMDEEKEIKLSDQMTKYNKDVITANNMMASVSALQEESPEKAGYLGKIGDKNIVKKRGMVVHKRTRKQYEELQEHFTEKESEEYCKKMGYSIDTIKRIGFRKFIDTHDWRDINDIKKWRTDSVHVVPCVRCGNEFTTYELDLGLCEFCKPEYDIVRFLDMCAANEKFDSGISYGLRTAFVYDKTFRDFYKK